MDQDRKDIIGLSFVRDDTRDFVCDVAEKVIYLEAKYLRRREGSQY